MTDKTVTNSLTAISSPFLQTDAEDRIATLSQEYKTASAIISLAEILKTLAPISHEAIAPIRTEIKKAIKNLLEEKP